MAFSRLKLRSKFTNPTWFHKRLVKAIWAAPLIFASYAGQTQTVASIPESVKVVNSQVAKQGYFYVGGRYVGAPGKEVMIGQMYVEVWAPAKVLHPYPVVLFHGAGSTATTWMQTPDGRPGWAHYFVEQGYIVYMVDQPARGRSGYNAQFLGKQIVTSAPATQRNTTATSTQGNWPQAKLSTQFPGTGADRGTMGNPVFDAGYARSVAYLESNEETQKLIQHAGTALLDKIGPAILLTHSQAGPFGWILADARPKLVKGIVAIEPSGPPFMNTTRSVEPARPWGPTDIAITYAPPIQSPQELKYEIQKVADGKDLERCALQTGTPHTLPNLKGIPITIITAPASYHAPYDHCTSKYLAQAGVSNEHILLADKNILGNGHVMPSELNNLEVAQVITDWLKANINPN
jgi:pimeloyl-ACP methyl ester carboxylesterase